MEQDVQGGRADCEGEEDRADVVAGDAASEEVVGSCEVGDESEEKWSEKEESEREEVGEKCPRAPMSEERKRREKRRGVIENVLDICTCQNSSCC